MINDTLTLQRGVRPRCKRGINQVQAPFKDCLVTHPCLTARTECSASCGRMV